MNENKKQMKIVGIWGKMNRKQKVIVSVAAVAGVGVTTYVVYKTVTKMSSDKVPNALSAADTTATVVENAKDNLPF